MCLESIYEFKVNFVLHRVTVWTVVHLAQDRDQWRAPVNTVISLPVKDGEGKGKVVSVLNHVPRHKSILREWRYSSTH
jgi:hypothetical protein